MSAENPADHAVDGVEGNYEGSALLCERCCREKEHAKKKRAMKPASGDNFDVVDSSGLLILRNLLKGKNAPENPAYRLIRQSLVHSCLNSLTPTY